MGRPRSDIQPRIVEAARARFLAEGVDGASLREIARDAETNIGMIVYYFPTKDDLFLSVVEGVYADVLRDIEKILRVKGSARERLRHALVRLGTASERELEVIRLMVREALSSSTRLRRILARFMRGHVPLLIETISEGVRNGEFDAKIPVPFLLLAFIGLGGLPQLVRRGAPSIPFFASLPGAEDLADVSMAVLFRAVGASASSVGDRNGPVARKPRSLRRKTVKR